MAESKKKPKRKGGRYCAAGAPNGESCTNTFYTPGISMHVFPTDPTLRTKWVKFVQRHRVDFGEPVSKYASLCSAHFEQSCFQSNLASTLQGMEGFKMKRNLIRGSVPSRHTVLPEGPQVLSERQKRQLKRDVCAKADLGGRKAKRRKLDSRDTSVMIEGDEVEDSLLISYPPVAINSSASCSSSAVATAPLVVAVTVDALNLTDGSPFGVEGAATPPIVTTSESTDSTCTSPCIAAAATPVTASTSAAINSTACIAEQSLSTLETPTPSSSSSCKDSSHKKKYKSLQRTNQRLKRTIEKLTQNVRELENKVVETAPEEELGDGAGGTSKDYYVWSSTGTDTETDAESDWQSQGEDEPEKEGTEDEMEEDVSSETTESNIRVDPHTPAYEEPKFIVFYSMLLQLFTLFCFNCKEAKPTATMKANGTMVTVTQSCSSCQGVYIWKSQPPPVLGKYPIGNVLLSFAILMAGASINRVLLVFRHFGLQVYAARTYFRHQKSFVFPVILHHWETCKAGLIDQIKLLKDVEWTGDGRFDSVGHCAKYGVYTLFCTSIMKIVHFELVQANETGGSQQTELEGAKRCFAYLQRLGVSIAIFVSDRHRGIAKWIRENCTETKHYYDIWHVARSITKKLLVLSKEKGCEVIKEWMKGIRRHVYWCATSTKAGVGSLIIAKWNSFMRHVCNKHSNHPDPLYKRCHHGDLEPRKWIKVGTTAYDKLKAVLTKTMLLNDLKKLSPDAQTSCLEGFHATLNHWYPKMICFSWMGSLCRHILASLHFNENINRQPQVSKDGKKYFRVTYPKFKMGEEVVREVACPATYGYVDTMKKLLFTLPKSEMERVLETYASKVPQPLNRQFPERKSKEEAVADYTARKKMKRTALFPSESEQASLQPTCSSGSAQTTNPRSSRKPPTCRICKQPKRGHKAGQCKK